MLKRSLSLSLICVIFATHVMQAQNSPILFVNKTTCPISIFAVCGDCSSGVFDLSDEVIVDPDDYWVFEDAQAPTGGCTGPFAMLRMAIPPFGTYDNITFDSSENQLAMGCDTDWPCFPDWAQWYLEYTGPGPTCQNGPIRVLAQYHNNSQGYNCQIVAYY